MTLLASVNLLLTSATPYISQVRLKLVLRVKCVVHSMQPLPDYFGLIFVLLFVVEYVLGFLSLHDILEEMASLAWMIYYFIRCCQYYHECIVCDSIYCTAIVCNFER